MGTNDLLTVQIAQQAAFGTPATPITRLRMLTAADFTPEPVFKTLPDLALLSPIRDQVITGFGVSGSLEQAATYEFLAYYLDGIFGKATPGAPSGYDRSYIGPTTALGNPRAMSFEYGDGTDAYQVEGAFFSSLVLAGSADGDGVWTIKAPVIARHMYAISDLTGIAAADDNLAIQPIYMSDTKFYVDAWGGTVGSTEKTGTLISFELSLDPKTHMKKFSGDYYASSYGTRRWESTLKMTVEYNATAAGWVETLVAEAPAIVQKLIRIKALRSATKTLTIDYAGTLTDAIKLFSDRDGNRTVELTWTGTYNPNWVLSTGGEWLHIVLTNGLAKMLAEV